MDHWIYAASGTSPSTSTPLQLFNKHIMPGRPNRSNSTSTVPAPSTKRPRLLGHSRTSSSTESSQGKSSLEFPRYSLQEDRDPLRDPQLIPQSTNFARQTGARPAGSGSGSTAANQAFPPFPTARGANWPQWSANWPPGQAQAPPPAEAAPPPPPPKLPASGSAFRTQQHRGIPTHNYYPPHPTRPGSRGGTGPAVARVSLSDLDHHQQQQWQQWQHHQSERMPASVKYQNKQLPATPRVDTLEAASSKHNSGSTIVSDPPSVAPKTPKTPTSPKAAKQAPAAAPPPRNPQFSSRAAQAYFDHRLLQHAAMLPEGGALTRFGSGSSKPFARTESLSSLSGATSRSRSTMVSSEQPSSSEALHKEKPFLVRNGRTYLSDPDIPYPLPVDLQELHRQSLRTLLLFQLFGGPVCSPAFANKPPTRVLEVGCGSGFWSMMCHRYYARLGHSSISFTGIDVAPIPFGTSNTNNGNGDKTSAADLSNRASTADISNRASTVSTASTLASDGRPDKDMKWRFVQHDMRKLPWPFPKEEFDLIMVKDLSLATPTALQQTLIDEYIRILRPGGTLEIWESDHTIRMLRPHVPEPIAAGPNREEEEDEQEAAASLGAYVMTANTPLSGPQNNFLVEYNGWLAKALEARSLSPVPCTNIGSTLLQEDEVMTSFGSRRLAVPLSEVRWEREGIGGVVTKDGKSYIESKGKGSRGSESGAGPGVAKEADARRTLTAGQAALRRTALLTVVQLIQSFEPVLREVSGKSQDEWDGWQGKMMNDLVKGNGASCGECLEIGAWWARKKKA